MAVAQVIDEVAELTPASIRFAEGIDHATSGERLRARCTRNTGLVPIPPLGSYIKASPAGLALAQGLVELLEPQ